MELKPCPFCGVDFNEILRFKTEAKEFSHWCRTGFMVTHKYPEMAKKDWQNAYCWKERDRLMSDLHRQLGMAIAFNIVRQKKVFALEEENRIMREALENICNSGCVCDYIVAKEALAKVKK